MPPDRLDRWERMVLALCLTAIVVVATACQPPPAAPSTYQRLAPARLKPGDRLPLPAEPLLAVTGAIAHPHQDGAILMDAASIEAAGLVEYRTDDPFQPGATTYRGALLADLLALWQVAPEATTLHLRARDGYRVAIPLAAIADLPLIVATRQSQGRQTPARAPLVLVWPYNGEAAFQRPFQDQFWVRGLEAIAIDSET